MQGLTSAQMRLYKAAIQLFGDKGSCSVTMSALAAAAGVARGTVHNNLDSPGQLFTDIAARLSAEMHQRVSGSLAGIEDPAHRIATGIRIFVRRAHDEPSWGRFINRFAFSTKALQDLWSGPPAQDILLGISLQRWQFSADQLPSVIGMLAGVTLSAMFLVLEGQRTWRDAGSEAAELYLRALGLASEEARALSRTELPALPEI